MTCLMTPLFRLRYPLDDMNFHGEGKEDDYVTSSLLSHDSRFDLLDPDAPVLERPSLRRAMLKAKSPDDHAVVRFFANKLLAAV